MSALRKAAITAHPFTSLGQHTVKHGVHSILIQHARVKMKGVYRTFQRVQNSAFNKVGYQICNKCQTQGFMLIYTLHPQVCRNGTYPTRASRFA
jgi:hypothetical protein